MSSSETVPEKAAPNSSAPEENNFAIDQIGEIVPHDRDEAPKESTASYVDLAKHLGALVLALIVTVGLFFLVDQETIRRFQQWGYFGIFMTSLIGNASIALPIPSLFFTFVGGGTFNWLIVGLVSGAGEALGESTGYLAGYGGSAMIENKGLYKRMQAWMERYGGLTIFMLSAIPNPIIDLAGIAAGASSFGYFRFLLYCFGGKVVKTTMVALAGAYSIQWLLEYIADYIG